MNKIISFIILLFLTTCNFPSEYDPVGGGYYISNIDDVATRNLFLNGIPIFHDETLYSFGFSNKFIIVKLYENKDHLNEMVTHYYILDKTKYERTIKTGNAKGLYGPFSKEEFDLARKNIGVTDSLIFTKTYTDNR